MNIDYLENIHREYRELTELLIRSELTFSCMESCTSGLVASLITDTPGASVVFRGGICAYSNQAKEVFGVPEKIIDTFGVYSEETALAMAEAVRISLGTDLSAGVTGSLCTQDPCNRDSIPGEVYLAVCSDRAESVMRIQIPPEFDRFTAKLYAAEKLNVMLKEYAAGMKKGNL